MSISQRARTARVSSFTVAVRRVAGACLLAGLFGAGATDIRAQWPQFRGPNGPESRPGADYPVVFSPSQNVVWKVAAPYGQSSPVVASGHVYLTASEGDRLLTVALDAATGRELWRRELGRAHAQKVYRANDPASPTAAADDDGVVVFFADFGLAAYTPDGKDRWSLSLGPFKSFYGMSASPIITGDLVVLLCDQRSGSFLIALDRKTGRRALAARAPDGSRRLGDADRVPARVCPGTARRPRHNSARVLCARHRRASWWMPIGSSGSMGTPVAYGDTIYVSTAGSSEPTLPTFDAILDKYDTNKDRRLSHAEFLADKEMGEHFGWIDIDGDGVMTDAEWNTTRNLGAGEYGAIAVRPGTARGKLDASAVQWRVQKNLPYIPAPLLYQNVLYLVKTGGIVTSIDPATGRTLKEGRSPGAMGQYYASPVAAEGKVFVANTEGKVTVLKAAGAWEVMEVNDLGEEVHATPALSGGRIYVRTRSSVYCFGGK